MESILDERKFSPRASLPKVWSETAKVVLNSVEGMEQIQFVDEENFTARLNIKVAFISLGVPLKGRLLEASPKEKMVVALSEKMVGGLIQLSQKITINLEPGDEGGTKITCITTSEMPALLKLLISWKLRSELVKGFTTMEVKFKKLA